MPQSRQSSYPKPQTPVMSPSHTHTVGVVVNQLSVDEEDNDICPVCDGECTCDHRPRPPPLAGSSHATVWNSPLIPSTSRPPVQPVQSLKIKITIPPTMLGKRRAIGPNPKKAKNVERMTFGTVDDGEDASVPLLSPPLSIQPQVSNFIGAQDSSVPKRRGRPPKALVAAREAIMARSNPDSRSTTASLPSTSQFQSHNRKEAVRQTSAQIKSDFASRFSARSNVKNMNAKKPIIGHKKRRVMLSESSGSDLSDLEEQVESNEDEDDAQSVKFPTFVSASALSGSTTSNESNSASSDFDSDSDSSIEAEEESFILTEEKRGREKARVRRELLGDGGINRKDPHNNWVIRARKKSVGPDDHDMDVDSENESSEDEDCEEEDQDAVDEEEPDSKDSGIVYAGVATGWSEDDESSFDADLFFANLSDSTAGSESSSDREAGDDGYQSDMDSASVDDSAASGLMSPLDPQVENLPFEITQGWDGQIVFTNGLREGQGILDADFEFNAAQLLADTSASSSRDSDVNMLTSDSEDREHEEDDEYDLDESDGDTTEEELVGNDGLPTERAMRLFRFPPSVSAIDPLSTVSPTVSPGPRRRRRMASQGPTESPKPADILAGRIFRDEAGEQDGEGSVFGSRSVTSSSRGGAPIMGHFTPGEQSPQRQVIIDGTTKDVPSPFHRSRRRRSSLSLSFGSFSRMDPFRRGRTPGRTASSLPGSNRSSVQVLSSEELLPPTSPDLPHAMSIDLDEVLDSSFLDSSSPDQLGMQAPLSDGDSRKHQQNLNRWDLVTVGAFRQTRETSNIDDTASTSWAAETPRAGPSDEFAYGNMMKTSPLSTMLWPNKNSRKKRSRAKNMGVIISPVILPVRDGDLTPTNIPQHDTPHQPPKMDHSHYKTRKEMKRENKMKRKSSGPVQHQHQHYHHHHHPNSKTRGSNSMQRTNFFSTTSSVPPLNL